MRTTTRTKVSPEADQGLGSSAPQGEPKAPTTGSRSARRWGVIVMLVVIAASVATIRPLQWRLDAIQMKLRGELPGLPWGELATELFTTPDLDSAPPPIASDEGMAPCPVLWETSVGGFWGRADDGELLSLLLSEQLERKVYDNTIVAVEPGDVVLDIGSHLGTFTRLALEAGAAQVIAFEPEPVNNACFKRTFSAELEAGRVTLIEAAAWHTPGTLKFQGGPEAHDGSGPSNTGAGRVVATGEREVQALRIDEVVAALKLGKVDFIKMDIEGAERHALRGALETLRRFSPTMALCTYHRAEDRALLSEIALGAQPNYRVVQRYHQAYFKAE